LSGPFESRRLEFDLFDCEVQGTIPKDLDGAFYRLGGVWCYPPRFPNDIPLHSDGHISRFRIRTGRVDYRGRFVRTERYVANRAAGRNLFGLYRNRLTDDPSVQHLDGTVANTTPLAFAGKLFALKEDGLPHVIDPLTLETLGRWNGAGRFHSQTFTAHPKRDPVSGELITFGYEATGPASRDVFLYTLSPDGEVKREVRFQVPYVSVMHDIAITQHHVIFPFGGYTTSPERLAAGQLHWCWDASLPSVIGILPRNGDAGDMRWFKGPLQCMMHTFNAHSAGDIVTLDAPFYDANLFPFVPNHDGSPPRREHAKGYVRRLTFDLSSRQDSWHESILFPTVIGDLGCIDPRFLSLPQRYCFAGYQDPQRVAESGILTRAPWPLANSYARFDLQDRRVESYFAGPDCSLDECCFIPRSAGAPEGDGYLIGVANNHARDRSELVVADTRNLAAGDIARVILPLRAGPQVHGTWVGQGELPLD
jgi:carotenoid cleavage dioxygenase